MARASTTAAPFVPHSLSLSELAVAAAGCEGCELYADATQTVFGAGSTGARVVFVGEQPGDVEDRRGEPFIGPAGKLLDRALRNADIDRSAAYVTNAVKHFRWKSTGHGARRLHAKPDARHVTACRPWLDAELRAVGPDLIVALGATAAQSLFGSTFRVTQHRGEILDWPPPAGPFAGAGVQAGAAFATVHPSAVLRSDDRERSYAELVADLLVVSAWLTGRDRSPHGAP